MSNSPENLRAWKRQAQKRPFVLGHRGARAHCPENTMEAFERALADGADGVELDVRMSADGVLFISHDDKILLRGRDAAVSLASLTSSQIMELDTPSGRPLPTLREVLLFQSQTGTKLNVELKGDVPNPLYLARAAADQIAVHGGDNILLSSFHLLIVRALSKQLPWVPVALLIEDSQYLVKRSLPIKRLGATAAHPQAKLLDAPYLGRLRKQCEVVNTWTVNDPKEAVRLAQLGVDALIGDDPGLLLQALKDAGM